MAKFVITLSDYGAALHCGASVEKESFIIDIKDNELPARLRDAIEWRKAHDINDVNGPQRNDTISISMIYT